jgi:hypothetical protein
MTQSSSASSIAAWLCKKDTKKSIPLHSLVLTLTSLALLLSKFSISHENNKKPLKFFNLLLNLMVSSPHQNALPIGASLMKERRKESSPHSAPGSLVLT